MNERLLDKRDLAYDGIADEWHTFIDGYDTRRRIEVLIHDFLANISLSGSRVIEIGAGLGHFTQALLASQPLSLTATDIAPALTERLRALFPEVRVVCADLLNSHADVGAPFDLVFCSEVVEHTPDPLLAIERLCALVAPNGLLVISTPNSRWRWLLSLAVRAGLRKRYEGYENWVSAGELHRAVERSGLTVIREEGIHVLPWHVIPKSLLRRADEAVRKVSFGLSVNLALLARRFE